MSAKKSDGIGPEEMDDYAPAIFARSPEEAEEYCQLLEDHDIPAVVDEEYQPPGKGRRRQKGGGVAVLVPESLLEDARAFIAEMEEREKVLDEDELEEDQDEEEDQQDQLDSADELEEDQPDEGDQTEEKEQEEQEEEEEEEEEEQ
jgi:hypothetical protein